MTGRGKKIYRYFFLIQLIHILVGIVTVLRYMKEYNSRQIRVNLRYFELEKPVFW